jgi:type IV secretory pathway TrbD component
MASRDKENLEKYAHLYEKITDYEQQLHRRNQKRIRIGLRCFILIPSAFLVLLLLTGSNRIIFLLLWIVSLFGLAIYLIGVEYVDYQLQLKLSEWSQEEKDIDTLIGLDLSEVESGIRQVKQQIEEWKQEVRDSEEHR